MESSGDGSHTTILMSLNCVPKAAGQLPNDSSEDDGKSASLRDVGGRGICTPIWMLLAQGTMQEEVWQACS